MPIGTTNVGRGGGLATPIFNHDAGAALFTTVQDLFTSIGNATGFKWAKAINLAIGASADFVHDFDLPYAKIVVQITDTASDNTPGWAYTVVPKTGNVRNAITITNTSGVAQQINIQVSPLVASAGGGGGAAVHVIGDQSYSGPVDGVKVVTGDVTITGAFIHYGSLTIEGSLINSGGHDITIWGDLDVRGAIISPPVTVDCNFTVHGSCRSGSAPYPAVINTTASGTGITDLGTAYQFDGWTPGIAYIPPGATTLITFTTGPNTGITVPLDFGNGTNTYPGLTASAVAWTATVAFPNTSPTNFDVVPKTAALTKTIVTIDGDYYTAGFSGNVIQSGFQVGQPAPQLNVAGNIIGTIGGASVSLVTGDADPATGVSESIYMTHIGSIYNCNFGISTGSGLSTGAAYFTLHGVSEGASSYLGVTTGSGVNISGSASLVCNSPCDTVAVQSGGADPGATEVGVTGDVFFNSAEDILNLNVLSGEAGFNSGNVTAIIKSVQNTLNVFSGKSLSTTTGKSGNINLQAQQLQGSMNVKVGSSNNTAADGAGKIQFLCKSDANLDSCFFDYSFQAPGIGKGNRTTNDSTVEFLGDLIVSNQLEIQAANNGAIVNIGSFKVRGKTSCNIFRHRVFNFTSTMGKYSYDFFGPVQCNEFIIEQPNGWVHATGDYKDYVLRFRSGIICKDLNINGNATTGYFTAVFGGTSHMRNFKMPTGNTNWRVLPDGDLDPGTNPYPVTNVQVPILRIGEFNGNKKTLNRADTGVATAAQAVADTSGSFYTYSPNANAWIRSAAGVTL